jgi:hypothetical protein
VDLESLVFGKGRSVCLVGILNPMSEDFSPLMMNDFSTEIKEDPIIFHCRLSQLYSWGLGGKNSLGKSTIRVLVLNKSEVNMPYFPSLILSQET